MDANRLELINENFDVGEPTPAGKYVGTDEAYQKLVGKLADHKFSGVSAELRANILNYYQDRTPPAYATTKSAVADWAKLIEQLEKARNVARACRGSIALAAIIGGRLTTGGDDS